MLVRIIWISLIKNNQALTLKFIAKDIFRTYKSSNKYHFKFLLATSDSVTNVGRVNG